MKLSTFLIGIVLGLANVIPGVSGGTMAVVFNVYDRLISLITLDFSKIKKDWSFLLTLVLGLLCGVILFAKLLSWLFVRYPVQTNYFFLGIILGSIPFIYKRARGKGLTSQSVLFMALGFLVILFVFFYHADKNAGTVVTELSFNAFFWLFLMGAIGAVAMIIPGISGSFILLILGAYKTVIQAVSDFNLQILIPVGLGVLGGLLSGAALVRFLLDRAPTGTYCVIFGLVIGSLLPIFPGIPTSVPAVLVSLATLAAGTLISWFFGRSGGTAKGGNECQDS